MSLYWNKYSLVLNKTSLHSPHKSSKHYIDQEQRVSVLLINKNGQTGYSFKVIKLPPSPLTSGHESPSFHHIPFSFPYCIHVFTKTYNGKKIVLFLQSFICNSNILNPSKMMFIWLFNSTKLFQQILSFGEQSCFLSSGAPDGTAGPRDVWAHCGSGTSSRRARFFHGYLMGDPQGTVQG